MMRPRKLPTVVMFWMVLAGCGRSANTSTPVPPAAKPDVIITVHDARHQCVVALASEAQGSTIPCGDVTAFVKDELRVPSGSTYAMHAVDQGKESEMSRVDDSLKAAGYRSVGGSH